MTETTEIKVEEISPLEKRIIRQIEYYFGDVNLPKDKFLKEKQTEDDGWVTIECLTTFNRLKELSTDLGEICAAIKKSTNGLMEVNEADLKVRRSKDRPLPDLQDPLVMKAKRMKTLYMKGFPKTYTLEQVETFLRDNGGEPIFVKLRKTDDYEFKGSIFAELETQEQANKLLENKELKCEEEDTMVIMLREAYFDKKNDERRAAKVDGPDKESEKITLERKAGAIIHFKNMPEGSLREDIKGLFLPHENVAWVDFNRGDTEGYLRFENDGAAQKAIDAVKTANDDKIMVKENELEIRVLEGEEEENYWKMAEEEINKKKQQSKQDRNRGQNKFGRGRNRRQQGGNDRYGKRKRQFDGPRKGDSGASIKTEEKPSGQHIIFDSEGQNDKKGEGNASPVKKAKVEE